ncbi:efflux RND transporter periplasmic adaptor subunit [Rhizobium sp. CFBP 8762]|uniref:efflux RND transporter periplasmic adaptor subunit n=1 Tax=Rhizobium sp. CFBP 8762 TaxID=2775279 RepID=UPI00177BFDF8|nr:efflux RND transporter periplasmic adaptor subunit [Rhizobium sp. CFBP 8762]MBD8555306.1 efflux RND transporter periplasmic adaptor subunit [Rhizobium sp. CFBP 8762]
MRPTHRFSLAFTIAAALALASCQDKDSEQAAAPPAQPPAQVGIVTTVAEPLPIMNELPGRIAATRISEVRSRATGIVVERVFEQGSMVKEGDVLYRIDPAPFEVQVASAEATLRRAQATQMQARQTADRQEQLRKANVASGQTLENAVATLAQADADVAIAQAGLNTAKLNLQYASVTAPISGRIGRALITEGALVSANGTENLATIQQLDPVYADFTQSATDLIKLRKALKDGALETAPGEARVRLLMDDGKPYAHPGRLLFSEAAVDATTGQVTLRGEFPNPDDDLLPGMYVRVQIEQGVENNAIAIPQQAVQRDASGNSHVYVVKADDTLELRPVTTGRVYEDRWMIQNGLKSGERVVVEGFQKIGQGAKVVATEWKPEGAAPAAETPAAGSTPPADKAATGEAPAAAPSDAGTASGTAAEDKK